MVDGITVMGWVLSPPSNSLYISGVLLSGIYPYYNFIQLLLRGGSTEVMGFRLWGWLSHLVNRVLQGFTVSCSSPEVRVDRVEG